MITFDEHPLVHLTKKRLQLNWWKDILTPPTEDGISLVNISQKQDKNSDHGQEQALNISISSPLLTYSKGLLKKQTKPKKTSQDANG